MKMSGSLTSGCVTLFFALTHVSAVQKLDSLNDLKKINFGQSVPKHSLVLLHWFANTVEIDNNDIMWLTFEANRGDYGSHHYGNFEGLLDQLPLGSGFRYYTIGNLNQATSTPFPLYVVLPPREYVGRNRDRIIIRVREQYKGRQALQRIDQVYMTQHYDPSEHQGTPYDPGNTFRITTNLLRQIREFSVGENQQQLSQLRNRFGSNADVVHIRNTWGDLASLGLLLFIVIQEKRSSNQHNNRRENRVNQWWVNDARESESNVPNVQNQGEFVVDFNNVEDHEASRTTGNGESGSDNTSASRNKWLFCCICFITVIGLIILMSGPRVNVPASLQFLPHLGPVLASPHNR
ncbi:uncharacterized protein LOC116671496 [Etheostoma spectabile]|uniref:uncharacterized protein LOC116671496 n=1 Tax=Etheostoma spectabile TaxID=54343 RepID=UPI0013AFD4F2|nr:uncharacterized protein LOC116671496 [Etheostoma spectabile]